MGPDQYRKWETPSPPRLVKSEAKKCLTKEGDPEEPIEETGQLELWNLFRKLSKMA